LGLNHEMSSKMSSRISSIYEDLKGSEYPKQDLLNHKIYLDAKFMSQFKFERFYDLFVNKYSEDDFIFVCKEFCHDFDYDFKTDLTFCKKMIKRIINSLNKKGDKIITKLNSVIKRIENERSPQNIQNEGFYDREIKYEDYK